YQESRKDFLVLHALDGYDEDSLTGPIKYFSNDGEYVLEPEDLGFPALRSTDIAGGDSVEQSASLFLDILQGKGTREQENAVVANAGMALYAASRHAGLTAALEKAADSPRSGRG